MVTRLLFVVGAPRSGTTLLARMLGSHSMIKGGPEPHLLTPLAHLGVWSRVEKAPYDHIVSSLGQAAFVDALPNKQQDYWDACRAYCEVLYTRSLAGSGKSIYLDKTPEYAVVLPFITKVFPDAAYIVLSRHPIAVFSSFANSFFDGDYRLAHRHDPVLERYVQAIAGFLRQSRVPYVHLHYEDLVREPEAVLEQVCDHIGVPFEKETIDYGRRTDRDDTPDGLGDPLGVKAYRRPSTDSLQKWPEELAADAGKLKVMQSIIDRVNPEDLETLGYPVETLWAPLEALETDDRSKPKRRRSTRYLLQRKLIVRGRTLVQKSATLTAALRKARLACDVLLREYS